MPFPCVKEPPISRLVLWNIDLTLLDVAQVTRAAYAEAFEKVTGAPLVYLASAAGRTDSELFFDFLARNDVDDADEALLPRFTEELGAAFARRSDELSVKGRVMPGAPEALDALMRLPDTVQTVVTGTIMANAKTKLAAFGLDSRLDLSIGGYGSENYPKASLIQFTRMRAEEAYGRAFPESRTVYITESARDVEAARIGRVEPIAVVSGSSTESQLRAAGAELILADLTDPAAVVAAVRAATGGE
ncbi:MAG TPA: haloacid dehalogenase-like hydrolase [Thermobifida alba]|nr:haloacid dehalogenase-like hydrolase [Thermobifida alba]